jgi:anhydro-N-acetylmuramic acid kinase
MQHKERRSYKIIGLMSGTSLDGLDICFVKFSLASDNWEYEILNSKTVNYPDLLLEKLKIATKLSGLDLFLLDKEIGIFYGESINDFISKNNISKTDIDAIASHGQTIFHQPEIGFTCQIGCGETIAVETGINTINDFRKKDVLNRGQGAPLVPIGDKLLFSKHADAFLNIGGFANFSKINDDGSVTAFDICPANIVINHFARALGLDYDKDGLIASQNAVNHSLFQKLNEIQTYSEKQPTSLGVEWTEKELFSLIISSDSLCESSISTVTEHAAFQISRRLQENNCKSVFVTGGGAKNKYLISRIRYYFNGEIVIPDEKIIDFKEALIFAFLGVLFLEDIPNCIPSVTGASRAVVGGVMHEA